MKLQILIALTVFLCAVFFTPTSAKTADEIRKEVCQLYLDESGEDSVNYDADKVKEAREDAAEFDKDNTFRKRMITEEINDSEMISEWIGAIVFWILLFVVSLFGFMAYCYCCCCKRCACCCNKKRDLTKVEYYWPLFGALAFGMYILVSSAVGASRASTFLEDYYNLECSIFGFLADFQIETIEDGKRFLGLTGIANRLGEFKDEFAVNAQNTFGNNGWIQSDYTAMQTLQNKQNPTNATISAFQTYSAVPPNDDTSTNTTSAYFGVTYPAQYNVMDGIVDGAILALRDSMQSTNDQGIEVSDTAFTNAIQSGIDAVNDFKKTIDDTAKDMESLRDVEDVIPTINSVFTAYFLVALVFDLLVCAAVALSILKKSNPIKICINFTWCLFMILAIVGALIATVFQLVVVAGNQACAVVNTALKDYNEFTKLSKMGDEDAKYIRKCKSEYGGDGRILVEFGVDVQLQSMKTLNTEMANTISTNTQNAGDVTQIRATLAEITNNLQQLQTTGGHTANGSTVPEYNILASELVQRGCGQNPANININKGPTDGSSNTCQTYTEYMAGTNTSAGCLNVFTRTVNTQTCTHASGNNNLEQIQNWVLEMNTYVTSFKSGTSSDGIDATIASINGYLDRVDTYMASLQTFINNNGGIIDSATAMVDTDVNCLFIGGNIDDIMDSLCVGFVPAVSRMNANITAQIIGLLLICFCLVFAQHRIPAYAKQNQQNVIGDEKPPAEAAAGQPIEAQM